MIPPSALWQWSFGGVFARLAPVVVAPLFDQLFAMDEQAYSVALDVLVMYVHDDAERLEDLRAQLRLAASVLRHRSRARGSHTDHHFGYLMEWILAKGRQDSDARAIAMTLARKLIDSVDDEAEDFIKPLLPKLLSGFPEIVWPLLGQAIASDRTKAWRFEYMLGDTFSFDRQDPPILHLPEDTLFAWCHAHPDVAPAFVAVILPMLTTPDSNGADRKLHPFIKRLLDEFGDREDVLPGLFRNLHTFGWRGSRTTYYTLYEQPLRELESHPIGAVRRWAKKMLNELDRQIEAARDEDEENEVRWAS